MNEHVVQSVLVQFANGRLPEERAGEVFGHLAFCEDCRVRALALRALAADPTRALHVLADVVDRTRSDGVASRSGFWAAVRVLVDRTRGIASITLQDLQGFVAEGASCQVTPIPRGAPVGDAEELARVSPNEPRVEVRLDSPAVGSATVVADARRDAVAVLLHPPAGWDARRLHAERRPRAVLVDAGGRRCHEAGFELVEGAHYLLAEFENLAGKSWVLGLEFDR